MRCPACQAPCAAVLFRSVECCNAHCVHFHRPLSDTICRTERYNGDLVEDLVNWLISDALRRQGEQGD